MPSPPRSKFSASTVPGKGAGVPPYGPDPDPQATPAQTPLLQTSVHVAGLPSLQALPLGALTLAGQVAEVPVHSSAASQALAAARQTTPALPTPLLQTLPLQTSAVHGLLSLQSAATLQLPEAVSAKLKLFR